MSNKWERFHTPDVRPTSTSTADFDSAAQALQEKTQQIHEKVVTSLVVRTDVTSPVGLATVKVDKDLRGLREKLKNITVGPVSDDLEQPIEMSPEETQRNNAHR